METGTFEYNTRSGTDQSANGPAALRTFLERIIGHVLELVEMFSSRNAFVFVRRHLQSSPFLYNVHESSVGLPAASEALVGVLARENCWLVN